jgi:hypothetical protein
MLSTVFTRTILVRTTSKALQDAPASASSPSKRAIAVFWLGQFKKYSYNKEVNKKRDKCNTSKNNDMK